MMEQWKPKYGQNYWTVMLHWPGHAAKQEWDGFAMDKALLKHRLVFRRKREAVAAAKLMLHALNLSLPTERSES